MTQVSPCQKVYSNQTNGGEDGQGEEAGLDVIPVERELLNHKL